MLAQVGICGGGGGGPADALSFRQGKRYRDEGGRVRTAGARGGGRTETSGRLPAEGTVAGARPELRAGEGVLGAAPEGGPLAWKEKLQAEAQSYRGYRRWALDKNLRSLRGCPRKEHFGEMVQTDGSVPRWQEERAPGRLLEGLSRSRLRRDDVLGRS